MYDIRRLGPEHVTDYRRLRLAALHDTPTAFTTSIASEVASTDAQVRDRIAGPSLSGIWGAWNAAGELVATAGVLHQLHDKVQHKATVYTVYVAPSARGAGLSRQLMEAVLAYGHAQPMLQQLQLSVTATNTIAHKLYQALGFVEYGCEPQAICVDGVYHDQILMRLLLPRA